MNNTPIQRRAKSLVPTGMYDDLWGDAHFNVVFDLDGTLADGSHREHLITQGKKKWNEYFDLCDKDEPVWQCIRFVHVLGAAFKTNQKFRMEIWSGRSDRVREKTLLWLASVGILIFGEAISTEVPWWKTTNIHGLKMRPDKDYTEDSALKERWLHEARAANREPHIVFDDRNRVVDMWRRNGITCCQVREGDF